MSTKIYKWVKNFIWCVKFFIKAFIWDYLYHRPEIVLPLFKTWLLGFILAVPFCLLFLPFLVEYVDYHREQERARRAALYQTQNSGEAILPLEEEKQVFSAFLTGLEKVERMASDWEVQNRGETIRFLTKEARNALPANVEEVLNCKIKDPDAQYPKCDAEYYTFYYFSCTDTEECSWTFCRKGSTPNSCIYSGDGTLKRGSYTWNHDIDVLFPQTLEFAKWVGKTHNWEVHN